MKITRKQLREMILEQMVAAPPHGTSKTIKTAYRKLRVTMTPAQVAVWSIFPKGVGDGYSSGLTVETRGNQIVSVSWRKRGGYAESVARKLFNGIKSLGFVHKKASNGASPDGGTVGRGDTWEDSDGNAFSWSESYGVDRRSNSFTAKLFFNPPLVVTADSRATTS